MTTYELLVIHNPLLTDQQYQEQIGKVKDVLTRNGAEIKKEDLWGKRRLAYPIEKQREGYYALFHFDVSGTTSCLPELDRFCKIEESVLRHMVTKAVLDKSLGTPPEQRSYDDRARGPAEGAEGRPALVLRARPEAAEAPVELADAPQAGAVADEHDVVADDREAAE